MFHISSPIEGWDGPKPERHHDFIDVEDFPECWRRKKITVESRGQGQRSGGKEVADGVEERGAATTWFVYILRCADGSLYTGITNDVPRRLEQHNAGTASRYTRTRLPVDLLYQEAQPSQSLALKRELAIKALSKKKKEKLIRSAELTALRAKSK